MATATFSGQYGRNMSLELKAELTGQNIGRAYRSKYCRELQFCTRHRLLTYKWLCKYVGCER